MNDSNFLRPCSRGEQRAFFEQLRVERARALAAWRERALSNANPSFNPNPAIGPLPPSGGWVYPFGGTAANTLNATTTNASTAVTVVWPGTSGLYVGQPIGGMGIAPNTTIAALPTATSITLSQVTTSTGTGTGNLTVGQLGGSAFTSSANFGVPNPATSATDIPGASLWPGETQTLVFNAASVFIPAPGKGYLLLTSGATTASAIQFNINGSWTAEFTGTAGAASPLMWFGTDGGNFRITAPGTGNATFTFWRWRAEPI